MAATTAAPEQRTRRVRSLLGTTAVVGAALMAVNLSGYLLAVAGSHRLTTAAYGLFGSLLALLLVGSVPALALQAVIARRTAAEGLGADAALRDGVLTGAGSLVVGVVAWPGLTAFLHVGGHGVAVLLVALSLLPLGVLGGIQGYLQGAERFGLLAVVLVAVGLGRFLGGVLPLALGAGPTAVLAGIAVGSGLSAAAGVLLVRRHPSPPPQAGGASRWKELLLAMVTLGTLLLLSSLDLLLARHVLPSSLTGRYAAGNVVTKTAFWLPQAIPLTALPRLSRGVGRSEAFRDAVLLTAVVAAASIAVSAAVGTSLVAATFGQSYRSIGHIAWLFALEGSALAGVQLLVIDDIAAQRRAVLPLVLGAAVLEVLVVVLAAPRDPRTVVSIAAGLAVLTVGLAAWRRVRFVRRSAA